MILRALVGTASFVTLLPAMAAATAFAHDDWTEVLERFVDARGRVDYEALARDRVELDRYLGRLAAESPDSHPERFPASDDRLAYWINAYNAVVFAGVLDRGVDTRSVWGDGLFGIGFFTVRRAELGGRRMSLKRLEDDIVRERFGDPRIHAALNCASIGCPRLPRKAFEGPTLDAELDAAMREFASADWHVRVDRATGVVRLSKIFDWFEGDFLEFERRRGTARPSLIDYVNRYRAPERQIPPDSKIRFLDYDKRLNRQ